MGPINRKRTKKKCVYVLHSPLNTFTVKTQILKNLHTQEKNLITSLDI